MVNMETIVSLCKRRGFIFPSSDIYGGFASTWDYGPLGAELKRNVKNAWWRAVAQERDDIVGLDAAILMAPQVWVASGHVEQFTDPMVDCKQCQHRFRADQVGERCPDCGGELTEARRFNMMFKTFVGPVEDDAAVAYLRPETAQGIFVNYDNVQTTMRKKLPFGIAQIGKAFRNEITPGNFTFRTREFEQMEIEYFVKPGTDEEWHRRWIDERFDWYTRFGMRRDNLQLREHAPDELAHYARSCYDVEYQFPMGWSELEGIANRTDYDLRKHTEHSNKDLSYFDPETEERYFPYVIEPSGGVDRTVLAFIIDAYHQEQVRKEKRTVLRFHRALAPIKVAVLPLLRNRPELVQKARDLADRLRPDMMTMYDDTASIGRLYRRQDEIGTLFCVTVDVDSLDDDQATIRERDSMEQIRLPLADIPAYLMEQLRW
ncbi:MAG: glycine--tRNA ligase [Chloroflexi bacterium]|nr:glycine--tRNA ligase [Chloroflexota bacterium]MBU1749113.1 glycine--tRNA ligase [Chloroflexota bacterium]MBU1878612.1 glycine--tRNA ligase [Chloroflexota bacterium]